MIKQYRTPTGRARLFIASLLVNLVVIVPFIFAVPGVHWDDAYIFFQYAQNLASGHGLAFNAGETSFGTTSILWTLLLVPFSKLSLPFWSKVLGGTLYALGGAIWACLIEQVTQRRWLGIAAAMALVAHPVGLLLAVSGMDTALAMLALSLMVWGYLNNGFDHPLLMGILFGVSFLVRPDFAIVIAVFGGALLLHFFRYGHAQGWRPALQRWLPISIWLAAGTLMVAGPWIWIVYSNTGQLIPPTRTGKLIERLPMMLGVSYPDYMAMDWLGHMRLAMRDIMALLLSIKRGGIALLPFVGITLIGASLILLLPAYRQRLTRPGQALLGLTAAITVSILIVFAWTFPIPNPRYIAIVIPTTIVASALVMHVLLAGPVGSHLLKRVGVIKIVIGVFVTGILSMSVYSYRAYLSHYEEQAVREQIGVWLATHTSPDAIVALEPIGEVGYYAQRRIVDLGGLVNSDIWPYVQEGYDDAEKMFTFLQQHQVNYLVDYSDPAVYISLQKTVNQYADQFRPVATFGPGRFSYTVYEVSY